MASPAYSPNYYSELANNGQQTIAPVNDFSSSVSYLPHHYPTTAHQPAVFDHPPPPLPIYAAPTAAHHPGQTATPYCMSLPYFTPQYIVPTVVRTHPPSVSYNGGAAAHHHQSYFFCAPNVSAPNFAPTAGLNYCAGRYANGSNNGGGYHHRPASNRYAVKFTTKTAPSKNDTTATSSSVKEDSGLNGSSSHEPKSDTLNVLTSQNGDNPIVNGHHDLETTTEQSSTTEKVTSVIPNGSPVDCNGEEKVDESSQNNNTEIIHCNGSIENGDSTTPSKEQSVLSNSGVEDCSTVVKSTVAVLPPAQQTYSQRAALSLKKQHIETKPASKMVNGSTKPKPMPVNNDTKPKPNPDNRNGIAQPIDQLNTGSQTDFPPVMRDSNAQKAAETTREQKSEPTPKIVQKKDINENIIVKKIDETNPDVKNGKAESPPATASKSWASLFVKRTVDVANTPIVASTVQNGDSELVNNDEKSVMEIDHQQETLLPMKPAEPLRQGTSTFEDIAARKTKNPMKTLNSSLATMDTASINDSAVPKVGAFLNSYNLVHRGFPYQLRGLNNPGCWCYVNAALQALIACPPFVHLLRDIGSSLPLRSPTATPALDAMVEFVAEFSEKTSRRGPQDLDIGAHFEPTSVYNWLKKLHSSSQSFRGREEDTEEFLNLLLNNMHDEMIKCVNYASHDSFKTGDTNGDVTVECLENDGDDWQQVGPNRKPMVTRSSKITTSPIANIFSGLLRNTTQSPQASAKGTTANLESFFVLPLDIQSDEITSIQSALLAMHKETIKNVSKTKQETIISRRTTFQELPTVLILQLKYFVYTEDGLPRKLFKPVEYGMDLVIDRSLLTLSGTGGKFDRYSRTYKLFAVVYHHGPKAEKGHYTTCVFHGGFWVHLDDTKVSSIDERHVLDIADYCSMNNNSNLDHRVPYLLFYRRCDSFVDRRYNNNNSNDLATVNSSSYRNPNGRRYRNRNGYGLHYHQQQQQQYDDANHEENGRHVENTDE